MTGQFLLDDHGQVVRINGYACLFDTTIKHRGQALTFARGAFSPTLCYNASGVRALVDHRRAGEWARTRDGSLRLWEDDTGLAFSAMVLATSEGRGWARATADGYTAVSIHFRPFKTEKTASGGIVQAAILTEISLTTRPAFPTAAWLAPFELMDYMPDHALILRRRLIGGQLKAMREACVDMMQPCVAPSRAEQAAKVHHEAKARRPLYTRARQRRAA